MELVMDNRGAHGSDLFDPRNQIKTYPLSPNCTSTAHLTNMGVTSSRMNIYRRNLLFKIIQDLETREVRKTSNYQKLGDMGGTKEGYGRHMLDVARLYHLSWN